METIGRCHGQGTEVGFKGPGRTVRMKRGPIQAKRSMELGPKDHTLMVLSAKLKMVRLMDKILHYPL